MKPLASKKVFVGMSGGVDSSVTALLLRDQGHDVVGVFMRCYNIDGCAEQDAEDARRVAEHLGIPFYTWDFEEEYKNRVVEYIVDGYRSGITPNPDVMCNREIKFGLFLERALAAGADYIATGHYVRLEKKVGLQGEEVFSLFAGKDPNKDQSYFLWTLTQKQLAKCLFPIGDYLKPDVREIARKAGLPTAEKKDSQGVCFLGNISMDDFLKQYIPEKMGALVTTAGENVGEHFGAEFYTIGQRHIDANFKFPKTGSAVEREPLYVASKNVLTNTVVLAEGSDNEALYKSELDLVNINLIVNMVNSELPAHVFARVRYRQPVSGATLSRIDSKKYRLAFKKPQKFVASGQSAVFYNESGEMLGGGIIV